MKTFELNGSNDSSKLSSEFQKNNLKSNEKYNINNGIELPEGNYFNFYDTTQDKNHFQYSIKGTNLKELVKDKEGNIYHCNTYISKDENGNDFIQRIYLKRNLKKTKKPKIQEEKIENGRIVIIEKERKMTKQHEKLIEFVEKNKDLIKTYKKFIVSRVLQEFKNEFPELKISYGLVKKVLEEYNLLLPKNNEK